MNNQEKRNLFESMVDIRSKLDNFEKHNDMLISMEWLERNTALAQAFQLYEDIESMSFKISNLIDSLGFYAELDNEDTTKYLNALARFNEASIKIEEKLQVKEYSLMLELAEMNKLI